MINDLSPAEKIIIFKESSYRTTAKNPKSTAFGLGQLLKVNRIAYAGELGFNPDTTDEHEQILMFKAYVKKRYGTANKALEFHNLNGWY